MKYRSINELDCFEFHDAIIKELSIVNNNMMWLASSINAMTTNSQNTNIKDMCVKEAVMMFENMQIDSIVFNSWKSYDSQNNLIESVAAVTAKPEEYEDIIKKSFKRCCYIQSMEEINKQNEGNYKSCFLLDSIAGMFYFTFSFSKSIVEWNEFSGEAWYEHPKWNKWRK